MVQDDTIEEAIDVLQQLGLKEYEARCFVGLTRLPSGTAKRLSEITDVPRTRVYDAVRVLEAQGLVEIQHTNPQRFRAVSMEEATQTLRDRYEDRVERLRAALEEVDEVDGTDGTSVQEVWSLANRTAVENRAETLLAEATKEVVLVVGDPSVLTEDVFDTLAALDPGVDLLVGVLDDETRAEVEDRLPRARTFVSGLEWLDAEAGDTTSVGRLMLVDRSSILVSSVTEDGTEQAIFSGGFGNGLVVISRRLLAQGLLPARDPEGDD